MTESILATTATDGWFVEITDDSQVDANTIFKM